ncbi:hypothetical protein IAT38_000592 [Cryptococcus sp. DSM 104549]
MALSDWKGSSWSSWSDDDDEDDDEDVDEDDEEDEEDDTETTTTTKVVTTTSSRSSTAPASTISSTVSPSTSASLSVTSTSASATSTTGSAWASQSSASSSLSFTEAGASATAAVDGGALPDGWQWYGCFGDVHGMPTLNETYATSDQLTPALCLSACSSSNYHFAGLENGNSCFCASSITSLSNSTSCNSPCTGSSSSTCGGSSAMGLYHATGYDPKSFVLVSASSSTSGVSLASATRAAAMTTSSEGGSSVVSGVTTTGTGALPAFTGSLMDNGAPRFRSFRADVVLGKVAKCESGARRTMGTPVTSDVLPGALLLSVIWAYRRVWQ